MRRGLRARGADMVVRWEQATGPELHAVALAGGMVIMPMGAIEQHGPHLAVSTDSMTAEYLALAAAEIAKVSIPLVLAPTMRYGYSEDHLGFAGTLSLPARVLEDVLTEVAISALRNGFHRLLFLNGHGSNDRLLYYVVRRVRERSQSACALAGVTYWKLATRDLSDLRQSDSGGMGHACELETSLMLHFMPDCVHMDRAVREVPIPYSRYRGNDLLASGAVVTPERFIEHTGSGVAGDPLLATAAQGARFAAAIALRLAEFIEEFAGWPLWGSPDNHA